MKKKRLRLASSVACPYCGQVQNYNAKWGDVDEISMSYHVVCINCGACGPITETKEDSVLAWKYRAFCAPPPEEEESAEETESAQTDINLEQREPA